MALEDMIEACMTAGVTDFELRRVPASEGFENAEWFWSVDRGEPIRWFAIPMPWSFYAFWIGRRDNPNRLFGVLPLGVGFGDRWRIGFYVGSERHGWQGMRQPTLEAGLRDALGKYLCESEGICCPHQVCQHHGDCQSDAGHFPL